jgi:hypothetical protein
VLPVPLVSDSILPAIDTALPPLDVVLPTTCTRPASPALVSSLSTRRSHDTLSLPTPPPVPIASSRGYPTYFQDPQPTLRSCHQHDYRRLVRSRGGYRTRRRHTREDRAATHRHNTTKRYKHYLTVLLPLCIDEFTAISGAAARLPDMQRQRQTRRSGIGPTHAPARSPRRGRPRRLSFDGIIPTYHWMSVGSRALLVCLPLVPSRNTAVAANPLLLDKPADTTFSRDK